MTESQRSIVNFKFSLLTFLKSMSCSISIEQILCEEKFFQLQSMSNAITCTNKRFVVWYILSGFVIQLKQSKNEDAARKKYAKVAKNDWFNGCKTFTLFFSARSIWTHGLVVKATSGHWRLNPAGFVWHRVSQCTETCTF